MIRRTIAFFASLIASETCALEFDASALPTGEATFDLIQNGEINGQWRLSRRMLDGAYIVVDSTTLYPDVRETAAFVADAETLAPLRVVIDADFSQTILDADISWEGDRAVGAYYFKQPGEVGKQEAPFTLETPGVYLRGVVFQILPALDLADGVAYELDWFSSLGRQVERVTLTVSGPEPLSVPAGEFSAYRIDVTGGSPENTVYIAADAPRAILRVDVHGMGMHFERRADDAD